ncbi:MAG: transposase [Prochlorococcaceae cyanobacterium]
MRGQQERTGPLFSYVSTEDRIAKSHPLRQLRRLADQALARFPGSTSGADRGYDTHDFVADLRISGITPHVGRNIHARRRSALDGRTVRHVVYGQSINAKKRIEQVFGWIKQAAGLRRLKTRGRSKVGAVSRLHVMAYNLIPWPTCSAHR